MPFIKRDTSVSNSNGNRADDIARHVASLNSSDAEARWTAARALGGRTDAVAALGAALSAEQIPRVREAILTALVRTGDRGSVLALLPYIRSQDAGQRGAAIEALQSLPEAVLPFMETLLSDDDTDVRLLATELARNLSTKDATRLLCGLLENEPHPNVCAAAIDVLAEVGNRDAVPFLKACAERFSSTPFLPFAVATTIARISNIQG